MPPNPWLSRWLAPPLSNDSQALARAVAGKSILLSGASFGIGAATALRLGAAGARLVLLARSAPELQEVVDQIHSRGGSAQGFSLDLSKPDDIDALLPRLIQEGPYDVVIHNAGKSIRRSLHHSLDRAHDFQRCMAVNYLGPVRLQLGLLPAMIERRAGHIVNVSSLGVRLPAAAHWAAYLASKGAFDHWIAAAVPELRPCGIACTSIYLGLVHTRMSAPTPAYARLPGLSADQAAGVLSRAIIRRPRRLGPWWLEPAHWLSAPLEGLSEWLQQLVLGRPHAG